MFCTACGCGVGAPAQAPPIEVSRPPREPQSTPATEAGERRHATVMFSDLSGYTALNEAFDPEEVEEIMSRVKREATAVIEGHGGIVNQFVGDEVMALFGVPLARRDDPRRAVSAALELHRVVDSIAASVEARIGRVLRMHTGVNTGLVIARRSDSRSGDFTLTGDTVNTAARLRSLAEPGDILVSPETWQQVSEFFDADPGAPIEFKGKERPVTPYRIRSERPVHASSSRPLVGRTEELHEFTALTEACLQRAKGRVIIVRGDPGVGKSRLVAEFLRVARELEYSCHSASVLDFGAKTGRDAVRGLAQSLLGLPPDADETARREAVARTKAKQRIAADQDLFVYDLVDVAPPSELRALHAAMSSAAREKGALQALCNLVREISAAGPSLLLVEDIHWAGAWALDRFAALAALAGKHPLLLVMTTRFAGDPTVGSWRTALHGAPVISIDLGPLPVEDALRLAAGVSSMSGALLRSCVERAEGNPLFLEQLLLNAGETVQANLPGSIQALVHARMDRLAPADKSALQAAAVLGQLYALDALRHLIEDQSYDCRLLVEQFLVRPDGSEFLFSHALIRDGAYASLLHSRQRRLHTRAAEWFESRDVALAAKHFDRAGDPRAPRTYLAASTAAAAQFRYQSALALAERGLELATERGARFALLMARARLLLELGRASDAIEACRAALAAAENATERAQALIEMAAGMRIIDRIDDGLAALAEAQPLAEEASLPLELSRLHHLRGNLFFPLGRLEECLREHDRALERANEAGSLEAQATALGGLGDAHYLRGHMRSANQQFRRCVALSREQGYGRLEVTVLHMVGWTAQHLNDMRGAHAVGCEAIELAVRAAHPRAEQLARLLVAQVDGWVRGNCQHALQQLDAALLLTQSLGAKRFEANNWMLRAMLALRLGDRESARLHADAALAICREHGMGFVGPSVYGIIARLETGRAARECALAEGEAQLAKGCVSHNHLALREHAIDASIEAGDWQAAEDFCAKLGRYTAEEPLPWSDFVIARGRALARFGRGERNAALQATLVRLRDEAAAAELDIALPALDAALAESRAG